MNVALDTRTTTRDPLARFDLDTLIRGAGSARSNRPAIMDSSGAALTVGDLDARVDGLAARLREFGLAPSECLLIAGGARVSTVVGLAAGLRAGLDVALAPLHLSPFDLAAFAGRAGAVALAAESVHGDLRPIEKIFAAAAATVGARLVGCLGPVEFDGAVDLDPENVATDPAPGTPALRGASPRIATWAPGGAIVFHNQRTLVAAALDLVSRARIGMRDPILSTIAPTSFAGLVAGPFAALLSGATLRLHGPLDPPTFIDELEAAAPAHLVAPGALAGPLAEGGFIRRDLLTSLLLLDRTSEARGALAPIGQADGVAIIDLHAFGEYALIAEPRGEDGRPLPAAREPHMIIVDEQSIVAARRRPGPGPLAFEGEAVSAA